MLKLVPSSNFVFDIETVPDIETARATYPELDAVAEAADLGVLENPNEIILRQLYQYHGATPDNPRPMLRYRFHRIVSISAVQFVFSYGKIGPLTFHVFRGDEREILENFFKAIGHTKPGLIGWSSQGFDIPMICQRALIKRVQSASFFARPEKPWEGVDYFAKGSDYNIDLWALVKGMSFSSDASSSLSDFCRAIGVPGKIGVDGADVADMWAAGRMDELLQYNMSDVVSTLLVWLHVMFTCGFISLGELVRVKQEMYSKIEAKEQNHWKRYAAEWSERDPDIRSKVDETTIGSGGTLEAEGTDSEDGPGAREGVIGDPDITVSTGSEKSES